jgi:hypothetical protein
MADASIYVAVVSAGAAIIGAAIPMAAVVIRDSRQAERDRRERSDFATRNACISLLRVAGELRILIDDVHSYRGDADRMRARVAEIRDRAQATQVRAANVSMLVSDGLAKQADQVASAASDLENDVMRNTDIDQGVLIGYTDVTRLAKSISDFQHAAVTYSRLTRQSTKILAWTKAGTPPDISEHGRSLESPASTALAAEDAVLDRLHVVEGQKTTTQQDKQPAASASVFISYSHRDSRIVSILAEQLSAAGVEVSSDMSLQVGASFSEVLVDAIGQSDLVIAVVSPDYLASDWAQAELAAALSAHRRVLPILVRPATVEGPLQYIQFLDATSDPQRAGEMVIPLLAGAQSHTQSGTQ